jgi:hypothetical protein
METRILLEKDQDLIVRFEKERLEKTVHDPMEREMKAWDARWRKEALEHYLPQGWSFGVFENEKLTGYFLGQPYIFHRGLTQTFWIEHLAYTTAAAAKELIEVAHKWAKDKHLQTVLMENLPETSFVLEEFPKAIQVREALIEIRSAKF